ARRPEGPGDPREAGENKVGQLPKQRGWASLPHGGLARWVVLAAGVALLGLAIFLYRGHRNAPIADANDAPSAAPARAGFVAPVLRIYAGTGQPGYDNGPALIARFSGLFGLSVDRDGVVYVADTGNQRIRRIITSGLVVDVAGSGVAGYLDGP